MTDSAFVQEPLTLLEGLREGAEVTVCSTCCDHRERLTFERAVPEKRRENAPLCVEWAGYFRHEDGRPCALQVEAGEDDMLLVFFNRDWSYITSACRAAIVVN